MTMVHLAYFALFVSLGISSFFCGWVIGAERTRRAIAMALRTGLINSQKHYEDIAQQIENGDFRLRPVSRRDDW